MRENRLVDYLEHMLETVQLATTYVKKSEALNARSEALLNRLKT